DQQRTADLGEVLARAGGGTTVRRSGGLGSESRLAIDGLEGQQVRSFLDGVPLELMGFPLGPAQAPIELVEQIEIYRGVVPIELGADALGGAISLLSDDEERRGTRGRASYQTGAWGTHRLALGLSHRPEERGFFANARAFVDSAQNDYPVHVRVADLSGAEQEVARRRFHDRYTAQGALLGLGVEGQRWAVRAAVRVFVTNYDRDLQNNFVMTVPYGEPTYGGLSAGVALRHELSGDRFLVRSIVGHSYTRTSVLDVSTCRYDWNGLCVRSLSPGGELDGSPHD